MVTHVHKCPWHEAWEETDLKSYGKLYCQEVDEALVRGFNPDLLIEVNTTKSEGAEHCEFIFHDANLGAVNSLLLRYRREFNPANRGVMPWAYHLGHLYRTFGEVLGDELGEIGYEAMEAGLEDFTSTFGLEVATKIRTYSNTDFDSLPE
jgi:hypothetical protein